MPTTSDAPKKYRILNGRTLRQCIRCDEWKVFRRRKGQDTDGHYRYEDETGRLWHGLACPECRSRYWKNRSKG